MNYKKYYSIAIPFIIATITQPLLGTVDTAVLGRLEDASFMGGVAIGTILFNTIYWLIGFLRVSTSGFSAQSLGTKKQEDKVTSYFRPLMIALFIGISIVLLQHPIKIIGQLAYKPDNSVLDSMTTYFDIVIWGAPLVLVGYVNIGWLMGRKLVKQTLFLQVTQNLINIVLDIIFALVLDMGVKGVAFATLISQVFGFVFGTLFISKYFKIPTIMRYRKLIINRGSLKKVMSVNSDLFIRAIFLLIVTNMFMAKSSSISKEVLAANAVLFQIQYILAYFYDGIGNATSVFTGEAMGSNDIDKFNKTVSITNVSVAIISSVLTACMLLFVSDIILFFTDIKEVIVVADLHKHWISIYSIVIGVGLTYYGMYTGCSTTGPVRDSMLISLTAFIVAYFVLVPKYLNNGLWAAFIIFSLVRSITLYLFRKKVYMKVVGNVK